MKVNLLLKWAAALLVCTFTTPVLFGQQLLNKTIATIAQRAQGRVGVYAQVLETGDTLGYHADERFPMQSVFKFPITMAALAQVDKGKWKLTDSILILPSDYFTGSYSPIHDKYPQGNEKLPLADIMQYAVAESDNTACDVLLRLLGGPSKVKKYLHHIDVKHVVVANPEKEIQRDWKTQYQNHATPEAMGKLLRTFYTKNALSDSSKNRLLQWMTQSGTGPKRIKGQLPEATVVAHKTGTSGTNAAGITAATNDVGIITMPNGHHLVLVVFVSDSPASLDVRESVIAAIAKTAYDTWKY